MNPVLLAILRGCAEVLATGTLTGVTVYTQSSSLRLALVAGVGAAAAQTLVQLVPGGAAAAVARAAAPAVPPRS